MKQEFFDQIDKVLAKNEDIYLLCVGLGYPRFEDLHKKYPDRVINTEASEQTALDMAVGLAYAGKIPFVYTITPFFLRGFETIRTYINHENLNIKLIGAGRDDDYSKDDGFSHDASDIEGFFNQFDNLVQYYPEKKEEIPTIIDRLLVNSKSSFVSLRR